MDQQQRTNRFGIFVILLAMVFRLSLEGFSQAVPLWRKERNGSPIYSETGRDVRFSASIEADAWFFRESPGPWMPEPVKPSFSSADAALVEMDYDCPRRPDVAALLEQPLQWDLKGPDPAVLILHTHTTESYTKSGEDYTETSFCRTLDENYNMLCIGAQMASILEEAGIHVIHDRQVHDYPSYNGSYVHSRKAVENYLEQYPSICLVLDLHRDALEKNGSQIRPVIQTEMGKAAQLMLVIGTDVSRKNHINWQENLALALKLQVQMERICPGVMRPLNLRSERFNQDLNPGTLLVEVGAAGNTRAEALAAVRVLAEAVVLLAEGTDDAVEGEREDKKG